MAINENALKRMHKELSRDYDNLGDYNSFAATMQNSEEARRSVHQALSEKYGKDDVGDYDYFMQQMGFEMPEAQQTGGVDAATGITAQHGVVAGGNVQQMNQQKRAQLAERMKQQNAAETAVANAQNAANDKGYQQFKQGYYQNMQQGGVQKRPQQQEQTQQVPQTTGNEPSNFVEQASQNAPEFYDVAMGKEKPDYGMQQSGQQDQTLVPLSREESQRTAKERREISSKIRTEQELQRAATTKNVVDAMKRTYDYQTQLAQQGNEVSMEKAREAREAEVNAQRVREAAANYTYDYVVRPAIDKALGDERFGKEILKVQDAKESARMLDNAITDEAAAIYARTAYGADFSRMSQDQRNGIKNELDGQMAGQMVEELSRLKAPTSAIEYYQRKVRGSMMMNQVQGFITNVLGTEYAQMSRAVEQSALTNYENSKNDKWYGGVLTGAAQGTAMFLDMMLMDKFLKSGATSWMNNVAAGSLSGYSAAWAPGSRGVAQAVVDKLVNNAWTNGIIRGSAAMASQYLTFGRIDAVNAGLGILNDPNLINRYGSLNTVGGWLNELGSDASNIVSAYAHGGETGAKLFTIGHLTAGIPGITGKALGFGAEVGFFTVNGVKEKIDEHNSMNPNDQIGLWDYDNWTQETLTNVGMIGAMKLMGTGNALAGADLRTRSQRMRDYATRTNELMKKIGMEFDRDDFYALERAGLGKMKSFDFDMMQKLMESGNYDRLVKSNELPLTTLFKLRMAMEHRMGVAGYTADDQGNVVATMNPYDLVKQAVWSSGEHGRFNVTAYGMNDEVVMQKSFGTPDEAKKYALALNYKGADNGRRMMEMMVGDNMHIVKDAIHEWADENGVGRLDAEEVYADWLAERENAMPLAKEVSEQIRNKIWAKMSENRQAIIAEIREDIRQKTGVDLNGVLQKPANMLTEEERDAFDQYTRALEERKKDDTTDPAVRIVEKTMDPKSGTVKFGTDSTGREVTVKEGEGKEVILTDPNTGEPIGMVDGKEVEITNEVPAEQVVEANKAAVAEAERQAGSEPVEEKPTENAPVAEEELPNGALAEEGTPIKYYDENNDLVDGTYIGPDHMQSWKHVIKDKNGNVVSRRLDEDEIVLPEAKAETTSEPINEAPAETENVNGTGTAPVAATETAPANAVGAGMPLNAKGKPDPIGNGVTPERAIQYFEEKGLEPEKVKNLVEGQVKLAGDEIAKYMKKEPDPSKMDADDYLDAYEQWVQGGRAMREVENRWKAIAGEIKAREDAARAKEEAIRKQMAAEEQARIDKIREEQRKETEERERTHREFMAELERKRKEQEALEAEQANEELTGDQMAEQAVMEEQKRRERMRIGQRLAEVGQLTDLDQPADEAMAAQVAYLSPDFKVTPESLRLELGSNFGKFGREGMLRLADNNGRTISEIADAIVQAAGYDENGQWKLDANKVREELIKCIQEGSASAIEALEKRVGIGTQRPEDRPEYWTDEKIAEYEARQQQQPMTEVQQQIATASEEVNTSPTDAQKEAGNYKKGHVKLDGMEISIEQPKGSTRSGVDADGLPWSVKMNNTYGYIRGTKGKDKDHIDIYLSDNPEEGSVFVVDQIDPRTGEFDEHKVMYGFNSLEEARDAYLSNYMSDWKGLGNITEVNKTAFKVWLSESVHKTKPFADYRLVKAEQAKMGIERGYDDKRDPFAADQTQEFLNGNEGLETIEEAPFHAVENGEYTPVDIDKAKQVAKSLGLHVSLEQQDPVKGADGMIDSNGLVRVNMNSPKGAGWLISHESGHRVEKLAPEAYNEYKQAALGMLTPEDVQRRIELKREAYKGIGLDKSDEQLKGEIVNDMMGDIFAEPGKIDALIKKSSPTMWRGIMNTIEDMWSMLTGKSRDNAYQVYKTLRDALREARGAYNKEIGDAAARIETKLAKLNRPEAVSESSISDDGNLSSKGSQSGTGAHLSSGAQKDGAKVRKDFVNRKDLTKKMANFVKKMSESEEITPKNWYNELMHELGFETHEGQNSQYFSFMTPDGRLVSVRMSGHPAKGSNYKNQAGDEHYSIVVQVENWDGRDKLKTSDRIRLHEYHYAFPDKERLTDIAKSLFGLVDEGKYSDLAWADTQGESPRQGGEPFLFAQISDENYRQIIKQITSSDLHVDEKAEAISRMQQLRMKGEEMVEKTLSADQLHGVELSIKSGRYGEKKSLAGMHNIGVGQLEKALKQGGLANPSTAVIDVDKQSHDKYGAVTLLMPTDLVAAKSGRHSGAYAGDIYSPNYPQVHTMMDRNDESRMEKWLIDTDNQGDNKMASYMNYRIKDSLNRGAVDGLEYLYLKEKGVDMSQIDEYEHHDADYQWKKIVKDYDHWYKLVDAMKKDEQLSNTVNTTILNKLRADFVKDIKPREGETMQEWRKRKFEWWNEFKKGLLEDNGTVSEYLIEDYFNEQWKAYHTNGRFEDRYTAGNASQYVNEHNLRSDYERWANEQLQQFNPKEKLYNGTDRNGRAKYVDNTLENASKIMKKQGLRAGDSFFAAGMGGARAQLTPVFKTLKEIKANKGRLDSEAFDKQKKELENEYFELGKLFRVSDRDFSDQNYYRLIEAMKSGDAARWAERNGYKLSEEDAKRIDDFGTALRLMPTDYFEIKFERPVGIEEFAAAIVPESMDQRTIKALQDKGLEVRTYKDGDEADRANVMRGMLADREDILFNRTWHGSAANFDEFDHSFMGTGEGSQVYGWGTYVSEVDGIAKSYADIATTKRQKSTTPLVRWKGRAEVDFSSVNPLRMAYDVVDTSRTIAEARQRADRYAEMAEEPEMQQKWQAALDILKQSTKADFKPEPVKGNRHLYEVEIPEDNGKNYLSWNDAVSADMLGRIKEEAVKEGYEAVADMVDYYTRNDNISGGDLYNKIIANGLFVHEKVKQADAHKMASKLLNNAGIVGVKVPTNNLRGGDKSKNNYVIFDEKNAQIVDHTRYNQENGENGYQKMTVAESDELTARLKDVLGKDNVFAMDQEHFDKALDKVAGHGTAEMIRDEGGTVYGFAVADKIYYNTDKMNAHTPVHEHGHIWTKVVKEKNPELYQRGMNLWKGAGLWDKVKSDMQRRGEAVTDDAVLSEVVSLFTGQTNEKAVAEITGNSNKSFVARCKQWLEDWWQTIKDYVGKSAFSKWSQEELDRLTKEEFASMPLKALYDDAEANAMRKAMGEGDQTRSDNFKKWFGDWENDPENASKVVDADGKPMVVYHGTQLMSMYFKDGRPYVDYTERFHTFKDGKGFFTSDRDAAESFARGKQGFYEVYLDMKKPFVIDCNGKDWDAIEGYENPDGYTRVTTDYIVNDIKRNHPEYDGVIFKNVMNENSGVVDRPIDDYVPFKAEQIKSAVDNNGDFSRENKDIRFNRVDPENTDDDPTTPGGGGSPSPTGGRERSLEEMIEYDAQEFSREFNRMKSEQDQIVLGTRVREFIRNRMTPLAGKRMTASDINGLMRDVDYAITHKSKKGLERALDRMQNLIHQAEGLAQIEEMMKALNTRTTTQDKRGMVKGVLVDETANEVLKNIKSSYQQMLSTSYDDRMSEVRREMRALKEQYGITRQDDPTAPEEFKTKMQELKDKLGALKEEREGVLTSQVNETVEGLKEMEANIDNEINNLSVEENGNAKRPDPEKMASLEQLKMALPIRRQLAELRQMMSAKQEIQRELDRTGSPKERHRLEKEMDMMQRRINITSREITDELKDIIGEGRGRRAEQVRADIERQMQIVRMGCNAVRDAEVQDTMDKKNNDTTWKKFKTGAASVRDMWQSPIFSFNFMAKYIDHNNAQGDGDFYNYFMRGENGALKANNVMSQGIREFGETVDSKCKEIFGKGIDKVKAEAAKVTDRKIFKLKADKSIPEEEWGDDSKRMTKGQMLYAWMSWRQEAGRTKMEADGWTKRSIAEMEEQLGPDMLELGRWITDDFLKALRDDKYNVTYEKVMGTSMHKANHYFPLRIDKLSIQDKSEVGQDGTINLLPSASSGNLIVRTTNRLPVDLSNDAFEVLEDYGRTMERWNAMAELTKDLNTLIKSQGFRNLMEANHEGLFDRWKDACAVATASYNTKATDADKFLSKLHNGFMQQAIGYGWYTALKQTLSAPAFWAYSWEPRYWKNMVWEGNVLRSYQNYQWAKENLPSFAERIAANDFGIEAINDKTFADYVTRKFKQGGMAANKLVDAMTVANGARAVYEYDSRRFKKMTNEDGSRKYTDEQAEELAKVNAQIVFNESQQSSRNEFSAPIQKQRGIMQRSLVAFQNSNIGYRRMLVEGMEDLIRKDGNKTRGLAKVATVGILNAAWYMGLNPALTWNKITGKTDDEEDEKFWDDMMLSVMLGYAANGTLLGPAMTAWTSEHAEYSPIQVFDALKTVWTDAKKHYQKEDMGAMSWSIIDYALKAGGVNLEKFDGMYNGVYNAIARGDFKADDALSILNMARTQRRELAEHEYDKPITEYIDDVMNADKKVMPGDRGRAWWGGDAYNKEITEKRAKEIVKNYLKHNQTEWTPYGDQLEEVSKKAQELFDQMKEDPKNKRRYAANHKTDVITKGSTFGQELWQNAMDEAMKDKPELHDIVKRYMNTKAGPTNSGGGNAPKDQQNETYQKRYDRLKEEVNAAAVRYANGEITATTLEDHMQELEFFIDKMMKDVVVK